MNTDKEVKLILIKENLIHSFLKDLTTFGFLLLCIWASWKSDNLFWQFMLGAMGFFWVIIRIKAALNSEHVKKFYSFNEAHIWLSEKIKTEAA